MWKIVFSLCFLSNFVISWEVSQITTPYIPLTHSIHWDDDTQSVYFVNYATSGLQSSIYRYSYKDGILYSAYIEGVTSPSFIIPTNKKCNKCNNKCDQQFFAIGMGNRIIMIKWNGKSTKAKVVCPLFSVDDVSNNFDMAMVDSRGRFYGGTLSPKFCNSTPSRSFYRYTKDGGVVRLFGDVLSSTGVAINEDTNKLYHFDTCQLFITEYDYDPKTGDICNVRVVFKFPLNGTPINTYFGIGLAIDSFGFLYIAVYSGKVWKINPWTGNVLDIYNLPVPGADGVAFVGPQRNILYVISTSAILDVISASPVAQVTNGSALYAITGLVDTSPKFNRLDVKDLPISKVHWK